MERLAERIGEALRAEAQAAKRDGNNISGWRAQEAEAIGVHADTFGQWYFGNCIPGGDSLIKLFARYGAGFANQVLAPSGLKLAPADQENHATTAMDEICRIADAYRGGNGGGK